MSTDRRIPEEKHGRRHEGTEERELAGSTPTSKNGHLFHLVLKPFYFTLIALYEHYL